MATSDPDFDFEPYRVLTWRRRLVIVLLAIATAVAVVLILLDPPGGVVKPRAASAVPGSTSSPAAVPDTTPCAAGQRSGCVGSKTDVLPLPTPRASDAGPALPLPSGVLTR